jgi:hypothetical protein
VAHRATLGGAIGGGQVPSSAVGGQCRGVGRGRLVPITDLRMTDPASSEIVHSRR